jgi:imidazole glycerol-phosphate synthase subunit HisH
VIVAVVDYRAGNLTSVVKALTAAGASPRVVTRSAGLAGAGAIVVPGVGHFAATRELDDEDRRVIAGYVQKGLPLLGICLGMQWLFEGSDEAPELEGLGLFEGRCANMKIGRPLGSADDGAAEATPYALKIPHVGWNTLERTGRPSRLLDGLPPGTTAYFTHSYAAPESDATVARTVHAGSFASVVERGRVFGTQFHPEKSGATGLELLRRFVAVAREAAVQC